MNDNEITVKENEDRRRIMRGQSDRISKQGKQIAKLNLWFRAATKRAQTSEKALKLSEEENVKLREKDEQVCALIAESSGVYGLHLNGDGASWIDLMHSESFSSWLDTYADDFPLDTCEKK